MPDMPVLLLMSVIVDFDSILYGFSLHIIQLVQHYLK